MEHSEFAALRQPIALVVDDEPLILINTAEILTYEGYTVVEAVTAAKAYAFLNQHSFGAPGSITMASYLNYYCVWGGETHSL